MRVRYLRWERGSKVGFSYSAMIKWFPIGIVDRGCMKTLQVVATSAFSAAGSGVPACSWWSEIMTVKDFSVACLWSIKLTVTGGVSGGGCAALGGIMRASHARTHGFHNAEEALKTQHFIIVPKKGRYKHRSYMTCYILNNKAYACTMYEHFSKDSWNKKKD